MAKKPGGTSESKSKMHPPKMSENIITQPLYLMEWQRKELRDQTPHPNPSFKSLVKDPRGLLLWIAPQV